MGPRRRAANDGATMPVAEHLGELRKRIIVSAVSILSISIAVFALSGSILRLMLLPLGATKLVAFFLLACGIAFQLPCVVVVLARLRVLKASILGRHRKVAYFILFIVAELITPVSDPIVAPLTIMAPLAVLFEGSLLWARRIERRQAAYDLSQTSMLEAPRLPQAK